MIYLDYHATTPCDPRVVEVMLPLMLKDFGNPLSEHRLGREALAAVSGARNQVAELIGAEPKEIIFTSGATESNNIALLGIARGTRNLAHGDLSRRRRIVTTAIEHKAVLKTCHALEKEGFEIVILPVLRDGHVDLEAAKKEITDDTLIVSIQAANNEVGTIQPVAEIASMSRAVGAFIHTDAAQAIGKIPVDVQSLDVDLLSISAHKLYGPKGVGALYIRGGPNALPIQPLVFGGGQEHDLRPGTLNVPGIVGLGEACSLCVSSLIDEASRVTTLRNSFEAHILRELPHARINGAIDHRLPGNSSLLLPNVEAEALLARLPGLSLSTGSACSSGTSEPSYVLLALGLSPQEAYSTVRVGIGRFTNIDELEHAADLIVRAVRILQQMQLVPMS